MYTSAEQSLSFGDSAYVDEQYNEALLAYTSALSLFRQTMSDNVTTTRDDVATTSNTVEFRIRSHRSAVLLKLQRYQEALEDAVAAYSLLRLGTTVTATTADTNQAETHNIPTLDLRIGETEVCLRRQALAAWELEKYDLALSSFDKAQQLAMLNNRSQLGPAFAYGDWIQRCRNKQIESSKSITSNPPRQTLAKSIAAAAPKYQYYQNDRIMTIAVLESGVHESDLMVDFQKDTLRVKLTKNGHEYTVVAGTLYDAIEPDQCKVLLRQEKVLIKLYKTKPDHWYELLCPTKKSNTNSGTVSAAVPSDTTIQAQSSTTQVPVSTTNASIGTTPYASHRNWNSIAKQLAEEEEREKPQGDDAMNKLFQTIYANADEDTRRAMIKSYQTSGGTVLSTNWNEVQEQDYEKVRTAPDGVEWKTWEGEKLPMKDD